MGIIQETKKTFFLVIFGNSLLSILFKETVGKQKETVGKSFSGYQYLALEYAVIYFSVRK